MIVYEFEIPDLERPIAEVEGSIAPSHELMPFKPDILKASDVIGRKIENLSTSFGTYGMGSPGFVGLGMGCDWLVISIWGASEWIEIDGRLMTDLFGDLYCRPMPWISEEADELTCRIIGESIAEIDVQQHSLATKFSNGMVLRILEDPRGRPIQEGNKLPREFSETDDLRRAVFLSPTSELWT